jgi:ribose/xylose/arabinose/galactoside ABC-type transport system permease subunit
MSSRGTLERLLDFAPLLLLALLLVVFGLLDGRVVDPANLRNVAVQATPIALLALGAFVVLLSGGIDLSAGFAVGLCAVMIAARLSAGDGLVVALLVGLGVAAAVGLVNGLLVGVAKLPPFVATLSTMAIVQGATLKVATSGVLIASDPTLQRLALGKVGPIPAPIVAVAVVGLLAFVVMRDTRFGIRTYAVGSDADSTRLSGVSFSRQQLLIYLASSFMVLLTAVLMVSRTPVVTPNVGGVSILMDAIAAAVIGGTSIFGGRGTVGGVLVGALIISLVTNALRVFGVDPSSIDLYKGMIIVAALLVDAGLRVVRGGALRAVAA